MGADVKQSAADFADSAKYLRWAGREDNKTFFTTDFQSFTKTASDLLLQMGLIKAVPDPASLADTSAVQ
jgi:NitT/TauT family transport system substrate-binding protein